VSPPPDPVLSRSRHSIGVRGFRFDAIRSSHTALPLPCAPDKEQLQRRDPEAAVHEQDQPPAALDAPPRQVHGGEGRYLVPWDAILSFVNTLDVRVKCVGLISIHVPCGAAG